MPRPRRCRRVCFEPEITYFKPAGVRSVDLNKIVLTRDELEAIRLIDVEDMGQINAGKKMKISQSTLSRLLKEGRRKIADALVNGKAIKIEGGDFKMVISKGKGLGMSKIDGRGRMGGIAAGPEGICTCSECGFKEKHQTGIPCYKKKCPKCGSPMKRG